MSSDIVEQGREREPASPLRRRAAMGAAAAVVIGVLVVRHPSPGGPSPTPPPVADVSQSATPPAPSPTPTGTGIPTVRPILPFRTIEPTATTSPSPPTYARPLLPCDAFLAELAMPKLDKWGATAVWTRRVGNTQTKTYQRAGGEIRISAGCGEIKWVLPLGSDPETNVYLHDGPNALYGDAHSPRTLIWRADHVTGWYRIETDGPGGAVITVAQMQRLRRAIDSGAHSV